LTEYDDLKGIDWKWQTVDGAMTKAPLGGEKNREKPVSLPKTPSGRMTETNERFVRKSVERLGGEIDIRIADRRGKKAGFGHARATVARRRPGKSELNNVTLLGGCCGDESRPRGELRRPDRAAVVPPRAVPASCR
jgi:hypothetical protein